MDHNWRGDHGYTMPSRETYPWMWLWDSCFHAVIYATLGDDRALLEAQSVFRWQTPDGMVPHMGYQADEAFGQLPGETARRRSSPSHPCTDTCCASSTNVATTSNLLSNAQPPGSLHPARTQD